MLERLFFENYFWLKQTQSVFSNFWLQILWNEGWKLREKHSSYTWRKRDSDDFVYFYLKTFYFDI